MEFDCQLFTLTCIKIIVLNIIGKKIGYNVGVRKGMIIWKIIRLSNMDAGK